MSGDNKHDKCETSHRLKEAHKPLLTWSLLAGSSSLAENHKHPWASAFCFRSYREGDYQTPHPILNLLSPSSLKALLPATRKEIEIRSHKISPDLSEHVFQRTIKLEKTLSGVLRPSQERVLWDISSHPLSLHCIAFYLNTSFTNCLFICIPALPQLYLTSLLIDCKLLREGFKSGPSS